MNNWICLNRLPWAFGEVLLQLLKKIKHFIINLDECLLVKQSKIHLRSSFCFGVFSMPGKAAATRLNSLKITQIKFKYLTHTKNKYTIPYLFDIVTCFGRSFYKHDIQFFGFLLSLFSAYLSVSKYCCLKKKTEKEKFKH